MRQLFRDVLLTILLGIAIPFVLFSSGNPEQEDKPVETTLTFEMLEAIPYMVKVLHSDGKVEEVELQEYTLCVVLKEMPASFEMEALKAQAVVARTFAIKNGEGNPKHTQANVCTSPQCCQGYCTVEEYLNIGGSQQNIAKVQQAVWDTDGEVIVYQNELIEATYFSCSGGATEDAKAVWGQDVPYLQSVISPGEEEATYYRDQVAISTDNFQQSIGQTLKGNPSDWLKDVTYTTGGGVATITIGNKTYSGTAFRNLLGLRSTSFYITFAEDKVIITTRGFGHRVGMSQYGADAMALEGKNYKEILTHYYTGIEITSYFDKD